MAALGTVLSVTQTLFAALESPLLREICSVLGYKSQLDNLRNTVTTVQAVLLDVEANQDRELSNVARDWIDKLKCAVYDADDLLDEFTTLAQQKQLLEGGQITKEVRVFFSRFNQLGVAYTMSRGIKKIRKKLDAIARDHAQFGIGVVNNEPIRRRNRETCSYVYEQNIVGREHDKKAIIGMLLDSDVQENVSFVTIVGIGGLGKTALAQMVYNDSTIEKEFPTRLWVCVSDQDQKHLDIKAVLCKILESATRKKDEGLGLDYVQSKLRRELDGKKYLLVLDDVWNENRDEYLKLGEFLVAGGKGSRIVVTTRSKKTAVVIGNGPIHELQGLSEESSWSLFDRMAFNQGEADLNLDLVVIGKEIVRKCANVPLAIRTVGTLLYGQSRSAWVAIQRSGFVKSRQSDDDILHIIKLSYYHLDTNLKSCFSYCAIFPKDYEMDKMELICLWMAQGYVKPLDEGQSLIDAGEVYFSILLRRCFFQDVKADKYGEITSVKMHDLMHDIALEIAGVEMCAAHSIASNKDERIRHVFASEQECAESFFPQIKIRTYVTHISYSSFVVMPMEAVLGNCRYLRALKLENARLKKLPCTIGRLIHLRHLNLTWNTELEQLPKEITQLHNLQTLILSHCLRLKELPSDLSKLVNLHVLDIEECGALTSMPGGMEKLTSLCILSRFIVDMSKKQLVSQLKSIKGLANLKGNLEIKFSKSGKYEKQNGEREILKNKERLTAIGLCVHEKSVAEDLQPHRNLKGLTLRYYDDLEAPNWAIQDNLQTSLPNLVRLKFVNCNGLQHLSVLGRLQYLAELTIEFCSNLEYVEDDNARNHETARASTELAFFPSLEKLTLLDLAKLKGWWRAGIGEDEKMGGGSNNGVVHSFPHLSELEIRRCPMLTFMPLCPTVRRLRLSKFNKGLRIMKMNEDVTEATPSCSLPSSSSSAKTGYLTWLATDNVLYLKSIPMEAFRCLSEMELCGDNEVEKLSEVEEVFRSCSSLEKLSIWRCPKLGTLSRAVEHLTTLHSLTLLADRLEKDEMCKLEEEDDDIPWNALNQSLRQLHMNIIPKGIQHLTALRFLYIMDCNLMETLPEWIGCLSSLQLLQIEISRKLKSLPDGIRKLTSLTRLQIGDCSPEIKLRCQNPDGLDFPKIQHIQHINIW